MQLEITLNRDSWGQNVLLFEQLVSQYPDYPGLLTLFAIAIRLQPENGPIELAQTKQCLQRAFSIDEQHLTVLEEFAHLSYSVFRNDSIMIECIRKFIANSNVSNLLSTSSSGNLPVPEILSKTVGEGKDSTLTSAERPAVAEIIHRLRRLASIGDWGEVYKLGSKFDAEFPGCDSIVLLIAESAINSSNLNLAEMKLAELNRLRSSPLELLRLMTKLKVAQESPAAKLYEELHRAIIYKSLYWFTPMIEGRHLRKKEEQLLARATRQKDDVSSKLANSEKFILLE